MQKEEALEDNGYFQHIKDEFDKYGIAYNTSIDESDRECINVDCKSYEKAIRDGGHVKEQMDELFEKSKWEGRVIHTGEYRICDREILSWRIINKVKK